MTDMAVEIEETPEVVERLLGRERAAFAALGDRLRSREPSVVVTGARGSSDHAVGYFKYLVEILLGVPVASIGPSVASIYKASIRLRNAVLVSVSQSGQGPDVVALQEASRAAGALSIAVVNDANSRLARGADIVFDIAAGPERSVAATKSCIASAVALAAIVAEWGGDKGLQAALAGLPAALHGAASADWRNALPAFTDATSAYVLGRGPALPVAAEAALKLKETSALHAEAFSGAEVMHGPLQLLRRAFPILAFRVDDASAGTMRDSITRLRSAGGRVFVAATTGDEGDGLTAIPTGHWGLDPLSMLLSFYGFAEALSRLRGHDPDHPALLSKVTKTV